MNADDATRSEPDTADPLGLRRCAKCLYDRLGLAAGRPCPECGYVLPAGVTVFTFARAPQSSLQFALNSGAVLFFAILSIRGPSASLVTILSSSGLFLPATVAIVVRAIRVSWSDDAYVTQLWISSEGIGIERDADRFSPLRAVARIASPVVGYAAIVLSLLLNFAAMSIVPYFAIPAAIVGSGFVAIWWNRRRAAIGHVDRIAPQMLRWDRVNYGVGHSDNTLSVGVAPKGFWSYPQHLEARGTKVMASSIKAEIDRLRAVK